MIRRISVCVVVLGLSLFLVSTSATPCIQDEVKRIVEDGIEVILNLSEPYRLKGEPSALRLEKEYSIDTEHNEILKIGLIGIEDFDIDSEENVYILQRKSEENFVYKFDGVGIFIKSFVRSGQGPGEVMTGGMVLINPQEQVLVKDPTHAKYLLYDRQGNYRKEIRIRSVATSPLPLANGNYLLSWQEYDQYIFTDYIGICNSKFRDRKVLSTLKWADPTRAKFEVNGPKQHSCISEDRIYISEIGRDYEINVYDNDARLLRKIRKEYKPVPVSKEYIEEWWKNLFQSDSYRPFCYFTKFWPPFRYMFADDDGHLFVMTYEAGNNQGEFIYDVFNSQGAWISRMSLNNTDERNRPTPVKVKKGRLYCVHINDLGYKNLGVYKMIWNY